MKLTMTRDALREASRTAAAAVPTRTTLPALMNVLIDVTPEGAVFTATDLDTSIRLRVGAEVSEPGSAAVSAKMLSEIAAKLPAGPVLIEAQAGKAVTVKAGRSKFTLPALDVAEFPSGIIPKPDDAEWELDATQLAAIASIGFAVSTEETRPILNGVLLFNTDDALIAAATDGHRLVELTLPIGGARGMEERDIIIHPRALDRAARLFGDSTVKVRRGSGHRRSLSLVTPTAELHTGVLEGPYPPYERVIPTEFKSTLRCNRKALLDSVARVRLAVHGDETNRVIFHVNGSLTLSAEGTDTAQAVDELPVEHEGVEMTLGANAGFVADALSLLDSEEVEWKWQSPERATLLAAVGNDSARLLIMPLRLI